VIRFTFNYVPEGDFLGRPARIYPSADSDCAGLIAVNVPDRGEPPRTDRRIASTSLRAILLNVDGLGRS
jgi:hypothetical protein